MNAEFRNNEQNKKFHAMCKDFEEQCEWAGERIGAEDWKRLFLAAHYGQKIVPNPFGGSFIVMNLRRSSHLRMPEMAELITQMLAFGNERGVEWTDPEWQSYLKEIREEEKAHA